MCSGTGGLAVSASVASVWRRMCSEPVAIGGAFAQSTEAGGSAIWAGRGVRARRRTQVGFLVRGPGEPALEQLGLAAAASAAAGLGIERDRAL
jgi:hypothetical protein